MEKTFVVTGASRGIGYALVQHVANQGHTVYALSRSIKTIKKTPKLFPIAIDIADEKALEEFANQLKGKRVVVDALVNNAGALLNQPFSETTKEDFEAVYRVNVFGLASLIRLLLPLIDPKGHLAAYSSSKGAVNILTELLAEEYKESGPSFNSLALGAVQTEMLAQAFPGFQAPLSAKEMAQYIFKFAVEGHHFFNGKTLPVSSSTP